MQLITSNIILIRPQTKITAICLHLKHALYDIGA